ncbi:MAG: PhnD/SsuA/transferrin family substrate-binding protein [Pseudomonadota bacterium]
MYDWPEVRGQNDAFWEQVVAALARRGIVAPASLDRDDHLTSIWRHPDLLLGQTCGLPLVRGEAGTAIPVARPSYAVEGCGPGNYRSVLLARKGFGDTLSEFQGKRVAINGWDSQSGCNALKDAFFDMLSHGPFFSDVLVSGAHRKSADLVAMGDADICALDAVAWALYQQVQSERATQLEEIHWTRAMPSLPYITSTSHEGDVEIIREAIAESLAANGPAIPIGVLPATRADYLPVHEMDRRVASLILAQPSSA